MIRFEVLNTPNSTAYCTYQPLYHPDDVRCPHTVYYRISRELTIIAVNIINQLASRYSTLSGFYYEVQYKLSFTNSDVLLTVHLSIILVINQLNAQNIPL